MKVHTKKGGQITFQAIVGDGEAYGYDFTLGITMAPDGTLLGMPVFRFDDVDKTTVTFDISDLLPMAMKAAGLEVDA